MSEAYQQLVALMRLLKEIDDIYEGHAASQGVPASAFWILYAVRTHGGERPYTQKELCREWSETPQTVNSALRKMQERGLAELVALPGSRREKGIALTKEGQKLAKAIIDPLVSSENRAFAGIDEGDRIATMRALAAYRDALTDELEGTPCK